MSAPVSLFVWAAFAFALIVVAALVVRAYVVRRRVLFALERLGALEAASRASPPSDKTETAPKHDP